MSKLLVISSGIVVESVFTQFVKFLCNDNCIIFNLPNKKIRDPNFLVSFSEELASKGETWDKVILIGDYWSEESILNYERSFEKVVNFKFNKPFTAFLESELYQHNNMTTFWVESNRRLIDMLDKRIASLATFETQPLITGMSNIYPLISELERYYMLFQGKISLDEVLNKGRDIVESQYNMVLQRVLNNSRTGFLQNGMKYCVTEAPELVNITHDQLKKHYSDCQITIIVNLKILNDNKDELAYSIRSHDGVTDVREILQLSLGRDKAGGDPFSAGGRRNIDLMINF